MQSFSSSKINTFTVLIFRFSWSGEKYKITRYFWVFSCGSHFFTSASHVCLTWLAGLPHMPHTSASHVCLTHLPHTSASHGSQVCLTWLAVCLTCLTRLPHMAHRYASHVCLTWLAGLPRMPHTSASHGSHVYRSHVCLAWLACLARLPRWLTYSLHSTVYCSKAINYTMETLISDQLRWSLMGTFAYGKFH